MDLSRKDITRLLDWWYIVQAQQQDTSADYDLADRLLFEELRAFELERTR